MTHDVPQHEPSAQAVATNRQLLRDFIAEQLEAARVNACCALHFYDQGDDLGMSYSAKAVAVHAKGVAMAVNELNAQKPRAHPAENGGDD